MEMNFRNLCGEVAGTDLTNPSEYRQLIGALTFLVNTRPNICFVVNTLSQYLIKPSHAQWIAAKHVLRYLHGTINLGLRYIVADVRLHGYSDAYWARSFAERKSTYECFFSSGPTMISWMSKKQKSIAISMVEAKYIATSTASCD